MKATRHLSILAVFTSLCFDGSAQSPPKLLPFQGRVSDSAGAALPDGSKVVQFKIYNAPVGGQAVWSGEVQKLTVNGGLVNTMLGSKASLAGVDFNQSLYLELTLDGNNDGQITLADPPLLPRQSILPAVFAKEAQDSRLLDGYDWSALFGTNNPAEGTLLDSKIRDGSVNASKIQSGSVSSNQIAPQTLNASLIRDGTITSNQIALGTITVSNLSANLILDAIIPAGMIAPFGGPTPPSGWLACDGRQVSRATYARLYGAITNSWGTGDGSTTFHLPDLRGLFLRGVNGNRADNYADPGDDRVSINSGGAVGNAVGSYQRDTVRNHAHTMGVNGTDTSAMSFGGASQRLSHFASDGFGAGPKKVTDEQNIPGSTETRPRNAYVNYIIKY